MKQAKPQRFTDDVSIVSIAGTSTGGRRKPLTRSSRRQVLHSETLTLRHIPSGREGVVEIPVGHYSRKQLQRVREEAKREFLLSLKP